MIITCSVTRLVMKRAKALGIVLTKDQVKTLLDNEIKELKFVESKKVIFSNFFRDDKGKLKAHVIPPILPCKFILFSGEWAVKLVLCDEDDTVIRNAFRISLGHEITHLKNNWKYEKSTEADNRFSHWVDEVHADFGASEIACNFSKESLILSCDFKLKNAKNDKSSDTHPVGRRIEGDANCELFFQPLSN